MQSVVHMMVPRYQSVVHIPSVMKQGCRNVADLYQSLSQHFQRCRMEFPDLPFRLELSGPHVSGLLRTSLRVSDCFLDMVYLRSEVVQSYLVFFDLLYW